jgi:hypothetical protein
LSDTVNEEIEEVQEDISEQINSLLGELEKKKSEGPLVMVSSGFPAKNEQSLSLVIKDSTLVDNQELSGPRFITSTDVKNNQFNLLVMQPEPNKSIGLT